MRRKQRPSPKPSLPDERTQRFHTWTAIMCVAMDVGTSPFNRPEWPPETLSTPDLLRAADAVAGLTGKWAAEMALTLVADAPPDTLDGVAAVNILSDAMALLCGAREPHRVSDLIASLAEALRAASLSLFSLANAPKRRAALTAVRDAIPPILSVAMQCMHTYAKLAAGDRIAALSTAREFRVVVGHSYWATTMRVHEAGDAMCEDVLATVRANLAPSPSLVAALGFVGGKVSLVKSARFAAEFARIALDARTALAESRDATAHAAVQSGMHALALVERSRAVWVPRIAMWAIGQIDAMSAVRPAFVPCLGRLRESAADLVSNPTHDRCAALAAAAERIAGEFYDDDPGAWQIKVAQTLARAAHGTCETRDMLIDQRFAAAAEHVVEAVLCDGVSAMEHHHLLPFARDVIADIGAVICGVPFPV